MPIPFIIAAVAVAAAAAAASAGVKASKSNKYKVFGVIYLKNIEQLEIITLNMLLQMNLK